MKVGRPTLFREGMIAEGKRLTEMGWTIEQIANLWGVNPRSIIRYMKKNPEFSHTIRTARPLADHEIVKSLYERAQGFTQRETHLVPDPKSKTGEVMIQKIIKKEIPGDPTCMRYWLNNRRPDEWRERPEPEMAETYRPDNKLIIVVVDTPKSPKETDEEYENRFIRMAETTKRLQEKNAEIEVRAE